MPEVVVGWGSASLDHVFPPGVDPGLEGVEPGDIVPIEPDNPEIEMARWDPDVELHIGGNTKNNLARVKVKWGVEVARFAGVLGVHDEASLAISMHMHDLGIEDAAIRDENYRPSDSLIYRVGDDRIIRTTGRSAPADDYFDSELVEARTHDADAVIISSLKSMQVTRWVLEHTPADADEMVNPGSGEFRDDSAEIAGLLTDHKPFLLTLNRDEAHQFIGKYPDFILAQKLADPTEGYADHVLLTLGSEGGILASATSTGVELTPYNAKKVDVVDATGAGDAAGTRTFMDLRHGVPRLQIVRHIAEETAAVLEVTGAHGDLYEQAGLSGDLRTRIIMQSVKGLHFGAEQGIEE